MSDWRIQQRYGYGAGLVPLNPEPVSQAQPQPTFMAGMRALADEFRGQGVSGNVRFVLRAVPAVGFALTLLFALLATITRDQSDQIDLEIVQLEPEVLPEPEVIEPEPPLEVIEPEPVQVAEVEPPPPAPPAPKLPPPPPKRVEPPPAPKPPPPKRIARPAPPKPKPPPPTRVVRRPAPPKVRIDPVPPPPERKPPVVARVERPEPKPQMPKIAPPPPIAMDPVPPKKPLLAAQRAPARSAPRSLRPPPRVTPPPSLTPVAPLDVPEERSSKPLPTRSARRTPNAAPRRPVKPAVVPSFDLSAPKESPAAPAPPPTRSARTAPTAQSPPRRAMPKSLTPAAGFSPSEPPTSAQALPGSNRIDRVAPNAQVSRSRPDDRLEGVALSSLAACRSDGEEEKLKVKVMAAIGSRDECSNRNGRYRFIETKNLNAFLMLIERAPSRRQADRCVELRLTLECLGAR